MIYTDFLVNGAANVSAADLFFWEGGVIRSQSLITVAGETLNYYWQIHSLE